MSEITVYGASDDLIEIDGDIREEFNVINIDGEDGGDLVAFSDGTILRIGYTDLGHWRISPVIRGSASLSIKQAPENDDDDYTDRATLTGDVNWVVLSSNSGLALGSQGEAGAVRAAGHRDSSPL